MKSLLGQINEELEEFKQKITICGNWDWSQKETIEQCILYFNSQFVDGDLDELGFKRYFYNINTSICGATTKAIDVDTKDFLFLTRPGGNPLKVWFYERDFKYWMNTQNFGETLNRICRELPKYGSVVLKIVNKKPVFVDLRNFVVEQNADNLDLSNYIIEQIYYTRQEFRNIAKKKGWKKEAVDELISLYKNSKKQYVRVFERYGEVENEQGDTDFKMVLVGDVPDDIKKDPEERFQAHSDLILGEKMVSKHPYFEFHINKIPGRWLGVGAIEQTFDNQIRLNEVTNQQVRSSHWSTLRLWQTKDPGASRNLLTSGVDDGQILRVNDEIKQVDMADRNYSYYDQERVKWEGNAKELTFTYDIMRGERTPAGTPLGSAQLSNTNAMSFFDQMREDLGLALKRFMFDFVIPEFKRTINKEHFIRIAGKDLEKLNELIKNTSLHNKFFEYLLKTGNLPDPKLFKLLETIEVERINSQKEKSMFIPKGMYDDAEFDLEIEITGEAKDARVLAANLLGALQAISVNPNIIRDPTQKKIFARYLEAGGIKIDDFDVPTIQPEIQPEIKSGGGGVSASKNIGERQTVNVTEQL